MIVPDIANPFFPEVVRGAEDTAHAAGYTLLIASSDNDLQEGRGLPAPVPRQARRRHHPDQGARPAAAGAAARARQGRRPDRAARAHRARLRRRRRRTRRQGRRLRRRHAPAAPRLPARRVHRRPARREHQPPAPRRLPGGAARLEDPRSIPRSSPKATSASSRATAPGLELLKQRPDAVFIANYLMTVGFMEALRQYRLRCPEDVAHRHLRRPSVAGLVLAAADHDRPAQARARRRRGAAADRADREAAARPRRAPSR